MSPCAGNPLNEDRYYDSVIFSVSLTIFWKKKQPSWRWFETRERSYDVPVMYNEIIMMGHAMQCWNTTPGTLGFVIVTIHPPLSGLKSAWSSTTWHCDVIIVLLYRYWHLCCRSVLLLHYADEPCYWGWLRTTGFNNAVYALCWVLYCKHICIYTYILSLWNAGR